MNGVSITVTATDNSGDLSYEVRDNENNLLAKVGPVDSGANTGITVTGLAENSTYENLKVIAIDATGNSTTNGTLTFTTITGTELWTSDVQNAATIGGTYFATGNRWANESVVQEYSSKAVYTNGTITTSIIHSKTERWHGQVKIATSESNKLTYTIGKEYDFSFDVTTNNKINGMAAKLDDQAGIIFVDGIGEPVDNGNGTFTYHVSAVNYPFVTGPSNGVLVFDFAPCVANTNITVNNIHIIEHDVTTYSINTTGVTSQPSSEDVHTDHNGYTLVWHDEFDGSTLSDLWTIEEDGNGGGNNELQYYNKTGVSVVDGNLALTAIRQPYGGKEFMSGRVTSIGKLSFKYGKVEARIKLPQTANGLWPAYWMMGNDFPAVGWPKCGELDILEMGNMGGIAAGTQDRFLNGAIHYGKDAAAGHKQVATGADESIWDGLNGKSSTRGTWGSSLQDGNYHVFTMDWTEDRVFCYIDNNPEQVYFDVALTGDKKEYFNSHSYLLFNLAIGGDFTSIHNANDITAVGPNLGDNSTMFVDYVRVWQKVNNVIEMPGTEPEIEVSTTAHDFSDQRYYVFELADATMNSTTNGLGKKEVIDLRPDDKTYELQIFKEDYGDKNWVFVDANRDDQKDIYGNTGGAVDFNCNSTWGGLSYNTKSKTDLSGINKDFKFHFDVKTDINADIIIKLHGAGTSEITVPVTGKYKGVDYNLADGLWHSIDIPMSLFYYVRGVYFDDAKSVNGPVVTISTGGDKNAHNFFDYTGVYIHGDVDESKGYILRAETNTTHTAMERPMMKGQVTNLVLTDLDGNNVKADSWIVAPGQGAVSGNTGSYKYTATYGAPAYIYAKVGEKTIMTNIDAYVESNLSNVTVSEVKPSFGDYKYYVVQLDNTTYDGPLTSAATTYGIVDIRSQRTLGSWVADWDNNIRIMQENPIGEKTNIYGQNDYLSLSSRTDQNWDWGGITAAYSTPVDLSGITDEYKLHLDIATDQETNIFIVTVAGLGTATIDLGYEGDGKNTNIDITRNGNWNAIDIPMSVFNSQGMTFSGVDNFTGALVDISTGELRNKEFNIGGIYFYGIPAPTPTEPTVKHEITDITNTTAVLNIPAQENATEVKVVYTWVKPNVQPTEGKTFETETHTQISTTTAGQPYYMPLYNLQPNTTHTVEVWYGDQKQENLTFETLIHQPNTAPAAARGELMEEEPIPFIDFEPNWQYQDVTNYEGKDNGGVYSFTMPSATYEQWQAQFRKNLKFINTDTDPDPEQVASIYDEYNYNLSFTVKSSEKVPLTASIESSETAWRNKDGMTSIIKYNFGVLETPNTGADKDKYPYIHTYTVQNYPGKDIPGAILVIDFGKNTAGTTVEISNISVKEIAKNDGPVVINDKVYDLKAETTGATNTTVTLGITTEGVAGQHVIYTITAQKKGDTSGKVYTWTTSGVGDKPTSFVASGLDKGTTYVFNVKAQLEDDTYVGPSTGRNVEGTTLDYDLTMSGILYAKNKDPQDGTTDNNTVGNAVNHTNNQNSTAHDEVDAADDFIPTVPFSRGDNVGKTINEWPYTIGYSVKKNDDGSLTITGGIDSESAKIDGMCNPTLWFTNTGEDGYQWMFDRVDAGATGSPDAFVYTVPATHPAAQNYNPDVTRIDYRFPFTSGGFINSGYVSAKVVRGDLTLKAGVVQTTERTATIYMDGQNGTSETVTYNIYKGAYNSVSDAESSSNLVATTTGTAGQNTNYIFTGLYPDTQYEYTVVVTDGADRKAIQVVRPRTLPLGLGEVEFDNTVDGSAKYVWLNGTDQNNRQTVDYTYSFNLNYNTDGSLTMIGGVGPQGDNTKSVSDAVGLVLPHVYIKKINESTWTDVQAPAGNPTEFYYTTTAPGPYAKGDVVEVKVKYEYNGLNGESQFTTPTMRFIVMSDEQNAPAYHFFDEDHTTLDQYIGTSKRVRIERSIKAGHWNSFCVPFDVKKSLLVQSIVHNQKENITLSIHKLDGLSVTGNNSYTMKFAQLDKEVDDVKLECGKPYLVKIAVAKDDFTPSDVDDPKVDAAISAFDLVDIEDPIALNTFAPEAFTCKDEYDQTKTISFLPGYTAVIAPNYVPYGAYFINRSEIRYVDNPVQMLGFRGYFYTDKGLKSKTSSDGSDANPDQGAKMNVSYMFIEDDIDEGVMTGVDLNNVAIDFNQPVYNINGQRVSNSTKGILIQNGRKFVNK